MRIRRHVDNKLAWVEAIMLDHLEPTPQVRLEQLLSFLFYGHNLRVLSFEFIPDVDLGLLL